MTNSIKFNIAMLGLACTAAASVAWAEEPVVAPNALQQQVSSHCAYLQPRRIVILTTANRQDRLKEQDRFAESLASQLRANGQYDVVISRQRICLDKLPMRRGKFDEHDVLAVSRDHNADTVLYCDVQQITAYEPMRLQTSVLLISAGEAISLVSTTSTLDLKSSATRDRYDVFAEQQCAERSTIHLHSPSQFIDFAASEFASGLMSIWRR